MENPPSASNEEFHDFLSYENLPGIMIPQKVYLDPTLNQEPKDVRSFATFYRHETLGATISAQPGATPGVSLAEALAFDSKMRKAGGPGNGNIHLTPLRHTSLKFVLKWPGCVDYVSNYTRHGHGSYSTCVWTAARLACEVARAVHKFYGVFDKHFDKRSLAADWTPGRIPFDKLYLLELRQFSERMFQPVLFYDAD